MVVPGGGQSPMSDHVHLRVKLISPGKPAKSPATRAVAGRNNASSATRNSFSTRKSRLKAPLLDWRGLPRQSVGGGTFLQKRAYARSPLLKAITLEGGLTFGDPFQDSGVVTPVLRESTDYSKPDIPSLRYRLVKVSSGKEPDLPHTSGTESIKTVQESRRRT